MAAPPTRRLRSGEELAFARAVSRGFHEDESEEMLTSWAEALRTEPQLRAWVATDGDRIVGNLGVLVTDLSLPGGGRIPTTAISAVGVAQTHRRRGLLRALMHDCLTEARELEEPVASLYASEAAIYGRFGFGVSAPNVGYRIARSHAIFRDPVDARMVEAVEPQDAVAAFRPVFETARSQRSGVGRTEMQWQRSFVEDPQEGREGASGRRLVGVAGRGYAAYRIRNAWKQELPAGTVEVQDLVATDPEAEAALWQHVCDVDLTATTVARLRPPDEAFTRSLVDPLRALSTRSLPLYTRLLDVPRALERRRYATSGRLVLRVHDDTVGNVRSGGTWHLEVSPEGGSCTPTDAEPDLELTIEGVSSVWLGGVRTTQLVDARQAREVVVGAAADFDRLLAADRAPWTSFMF